MYLRIIPRILQGYTFQRWESRSSVRWRGILGGQFRQGPKGKPTGNSSSQNPSRRQCKATYSKSDFLNFRLTTRTIFIYLLQKELVEISEKRIHVCSCVYYLCLYWLCNNRRKELDRSHISLWGMTPSQVSRT